MKTRLKPLSLISVLLIASGVLLSVPSNSHAVIDTDANFAQKWYVESDSNNFDATSITADDAYIYAVGYDNVLGNRQWHIEKRDKISGSLVNSFGTNGVVTSNPSGNHDYPHEIAIEGSFIYIAGTDCTNNNDPIFRYEKRDTVTGNLVVSFGSGGVVSYNPGSFSDNFADLIIYENNIYAAAAIDGWPGTDAKRYLEKRSALTGTLDNSYGTNGVVIDNPGLNQYDTYTDMEIRNDYIYTVGSIQGNSKARIEKRGADTGSLVNGFGTTGIIDVNPSQSYDSLSSIAVSDNYFIVGGNDSINDGGAHFQWRVEKRSNSDGALITTFSTDGVLSINPSSQDDWIDALELNSDSLFIIGSDATYYTDGVDFDSQIRIEKRDPTDGSLQTNLD